MKLALAKSEQEACSECAWEPKSKHDRAKQSGSQLAEPCDTAVSAVKYLTVSPSQMLASSESTLPSAMSCRNDASVEF
jgi:hypothetical protein